jgi:hypothetical protein
MLEVEIKSPAEEKALDKDLRFAILRQIHDSYNELASIEEVIAVLPTVMEDLKQIGNWYKLNRAIVDHIYDNYEYFFHREEAPTARYVSWGK